MDFAFDLVKWLWRYLVEDETIQSLIKLLGNYLAAFAFRAALPITYLLVVWPFYRAAMVRYALTKRIDANAKPVRIRLGGIS